jgi:hypothetical protein
MAVSVDSKLLAPPRTTQAQAERFLIPKPNGEYTDADVRFILTQYFTVAPSVGLDPLLAVAQMELETAFLASFWAARPRRNPAGIGVTGAPNAGISFPSWKLSVRAHLGRLAAYALPENKGTAAQKALITEALKWRSLPPDRRGIAPTLKGLAGSWAADKKYADKIVTIANAMLKV